MTESSPPRRLIDRQGIAALADVTPAAVTNWIRRYPGEFPEAVDGEFFDAEEVQEWLTRTGRARKVDITADRLGANLLALLRLDLPRDAIRGYALTLISIAASTQDAPWESPIAAAEHLESEGVFPRGSLTGPLITASVAKPTAEGALKAAYQTIQRGQANQIPATEIFERLVQANLSSRISVGRMSTDELASFMTALLPENCQSVYDPACGVGGILRAAHQWLGSTARLSGTDIDPASWALCVQRLHLSRVEADIRCMDAADALEQPPKTRVEAIVTSPPFGTVAEPGTPMSRLAARHQLQNRSDLVWVLAALEHIAPEGTVVIATPPRALFSAVRAEREARRELVRSGALRAVFLLPSGALALNVRAAVLVLKQATQDPPPVLLVDAESSDLTGPQSVLDQYKEWRAAPDRFHGDGVKSTTVPVLELMAGEVTLDPSYWLKVERDPTQTLLHLDRQWTDLVGSQGDLPGPLGPLTIEPGVAAPPEVTLQQMADAGQIEILRPTGTQGPGTQTSAQPVIRNITSDGNLEHSRKNNQPMATVKSRPGDIILKTAGRIEAVVDFEGGHLISGHLWVIRPLVQAASLDPELLAHLLRSPRIRAIAESRASTAPRLTHPKQVSLPKLSDEQASLLLGRLRQLQELQVAANKVAKDAADAIDALIEAIETGNTLRKAEQ